MGIRLTLCARIAASQGALKVKKPTVKWTSYDGNILHGLPDPEESENGLCADINIGCGFPNRRLVMVYQSENADTENSGPAGVVDQIAQYVDNRDSLPLTAALRPMHSAVAQEITEIRWAQPCFSRRVGEACRWL